MELIYIIIAIVILRQCSKFLRNWNKVDEFELQAIEFERMYNKILEEMQRKDIDEIEYEGRRIRCNIRFKTNDKSEFYRQMSLISKDVLEIFDQIDDSYWMWMDEERQIVIKRHYDIILEVSNKMSYLAWLNGNE